MVSERGEISVATIKQFTDHMAGRVLLRDGGGYASLLSCYANRADAEARQRQIKENLEITGVSSSSVVEDIRWISLKIQEVKKRKIDDPSDYYSFEEKFVDLRRLELAKRLSMQTEGLSIAVTQEVANMVSHELVSVRESLKTAQINGDLAAAQEISYGLINVVREEWDKKPENVELYLLSRSFIEGGVLAKIDLINQAANIIYADPEENDLSSVDNLIAGIDIILRYIAVAGVSIPVIYNKYKDCLNIDSAWLDKVTNTPVNNSSQPTKGAEPLGLPVGSSPLGNMPGGTFLRPFNNIGLLVGANSYSRVGRLAMVGVVGKEHVARSNIVAHVVEQIANG